VRLRKRLPGKGRRLRQFHEAISRSYEPLFFSILSWHTNIPGRSRLYISKKEDVMLRLTIAEVLGKTMLKEQEIPEIAKAFLHVIENEEVPPEWYVVKYTLYPEMRHRGIRLVFFDDAGEIDYLDSIIVKGEVVYEYRMNGRTKNWLWKDFGDLLNDAVHLFSERFTKAILS